MLQFTASPPPAVDYRRQARRLRCRLAHDPAGMHTALGALARQADAVRPKLPIVRRVFVDETVMPEAAIPNAGVRDFAQAVAVELRGPILRYSRRQALLKQATALGIGRFDANLIIAAVQHRMGSEKPLEGSAENRFNGHRFSWHRWAIAACVVVVQSLIVVGAMTILR